MNKFLMMTAAAMIMGSPLFAQSTQPDLSGLQALVNSGQPLTEQQVRDALAGYTVTGVRLDDDGEARAEFVDANGQVYRVRIDDGQVFYRTSDDPAGSEDLDDDNGGTSGVSSDDNDDSDDNGGSSGSTSGDNDDDSGDDNGGSSGSTSGDNDDDSGDDNGGSSGGDDD